MDTIGRLRERVEELEEEVRQLKAALKLKNVVLPPEWNLSKTEATILKMLLRDQTVIDESLHVALWGLRPDGGPDTKNNVCAHLSRLKKKVPGGGIYHAFRRKHGTYSIHPRLREDLQIEVEAYASQRWDGPMKDYSAKAPEEKERRLQA